MTEETNVAVPAADANVAQPETEEVTNKTPEAAPEGEQPKEPEKTVEPTDEDDGDDEPRKRVSRSERYRRRIQALETEIMSLKGRFAEPEHGSGKDAPKAPKQEEFADYFEFIAAKTAFEVEQRMVNRERERTEQDVQRAEQSRRQVISEAYGERVRDAIERIPDFEDVLRKASDVPLPPHMADVIQQSEVGPLLAYHLAKNKSEARRIAGLPPLEMARELGRLEPSLAMPKPKTQSKAPPPVGAVKGASAPPAKDLGKMSMEDYAAARKAELAEQRKR